ncbi:MAG: DUF3347 domain-containing protein [Flavobacteriaceae bacterium]
MKKVSITTIIIMALVILTAMSCKNDKKESSHDGTLTEMSSEDGYHHGDVDSGMEHDKSVSTNNTMDSDTQTSDVKKVLVDYMILKDALVTDNKDEAAKAGKKMENTLNGFNISSYTVEQQRELKDIIEDAIDHAEHIGKSDIAHQREHFKILSKDMIDMVAITGTETTIYQQFCPMYDNGSSWLSMSNEIKNPYYGSKMLNCGEVQKTIN